jgi:hypothetical protein
MKHILCVYSASAAVTYGHGIILHASCECGYQVCFSISIWAGITKDIILGPLSATGASWRCASSCKAEVVVSAQWSPSMVWGRRTAVVECDISRIVDWMSRADCMASSATRSNSDGFFPVGTPEGAHLHVPSQGYLRSPQKTSWGCDDGQCQHVKVWMPYSTLPSAWNGWRPLWTRTVTNHEAVMVNHLTMMCAHMLLRPC